MLTYKDLPLFIMLLFYASIFTISIYAIVKNGKSRRHKVDFNRALKDSLSVDTSIGVESDDGGSSSLKKALDYYPRLYKKAGIVSNHYSNDKINLRIAMLALATALAIQFITGTLILSLFSIGGTLLGVYLYAKKKIDTKTQIVFSQIPGFIDIFKSNVEANESPSNALLGAINSTAMPLYGELEEARSVIQIGSFAEAVKLLMTSTTNNTLRHFFACIDLSNDVGSDLTAQIEVIQDIIESDEDLRRQKHAAVSSQKSLMYVGTSVSPILFVILNSIGDMGTAFWFNSLISWILFFGCAAGIIMGLILAKGAIDEISL